MLVLRESHKVAGIHEYEFEDLVRDEWMPALAETDGARLLYYLDVAHGSGASYNIITYTGLEDGAAWDRVRDRVEAGDSSGDVTGLGTRGEGSWQTWLVTSGRCHR